MKILIIRLSSIGDIVLTTPVIRCIKQQIKGAEVHFLTKASFESVLRSNPYIDQLHLFRGDLNATTRELKAEHFDYVIDLHKNLRTLRMKMRLGVKSSSFDKLNIEKWLLVNFKIDKMPAVHIVDRYLAAAAPLGVQNDGKGLDYFLEKEHDLSSLLPPSHQKYTGFVIGGQHATKRLPQEKIIAACKLVNAPIVLLGGKEDAARAEEICRGTGEYVFNGCGKFNLDQSAFLVKMADTIVTHDTGLMHIAAAFNKRIVSIWGNTVPEFGMYPYKADHQKIIEVKGLPCRPCSKIGYPECPQKHFRCMYDTDLDQLKDFI